ncbi:MAG: hypothetical protein R6X32_16180 [Chloroflexota bacterium]|jgi:hypothetical protein
MSFLLTLHGEIRWILALVAVIAIVRFTLGWLRRAEYKGMDRGLMAAYTGFLDLNFLLGLILLFGLGGGLPAHRIEHAVTMLIAVGVAHSSAAWRKSDDAALKFRNNLIVVVASLLFVILGVIRLRGGWLW